MASHVAFCQKVKFPEIAIMSVILGGGDVQVIIIDTFKGPGEVKNPLGSSKLPPPAR